MQRRGRMGRMRRACYIRGACYFLLLKYGSICKHCSLSGVGRKGGCYFSFFLFEIFLEKKKLK